MRNTTGDRCEIEREKESERESMCVRERVCERVRSRKEDQ